MLQDFIADYCIVPSRKSRETMRGHKNFRPFVIIALGLASIGCFNYHQKFILYKQPIYSPENNITEVKLNTSGVYFIFDDRYENLSNFLFFYPNGQVYVAPSFIVNKESNKFWGNPEDYFNNSVKKHYAISKRDYWGHYSINADSIVIQYFFHNEQISVPRKRDIIELHGQIISDTEISINKKVCVWWNDYFETDKYSKDGKITFAPPFTYKFYKTDSKPDSTKAWFINKHWYKKDLHPSRK